MHLGTSYPWFLTPCFTIPHDYHPHSHLCLSYADHYHHTRTQSYVIRFDLSTLWRRVNREYSIPRGQPMLSMIYTAYVRGFLWAVIMLLDDSHMNTSHRITLGLVTWFAITYSRHPIRASHVVFRVITHESCVNWISNRVQRIHFWWCSNVTITGKTRFHLASAVDIVFNHIHYLRY